MHHADIHPKRRPGVAADIADLPFVGAIVVCRTTDRRDQEATRRQLLSWMLPRLQYEQHVTHALLESRQVSDRHDRRTVGRLRASRIITTALRVDHLAKRATDSERLWLADFVMGAYTGAQLHDAPESWAILTARHIIDVHEL